MSKPKQPKQPNPYQTADAQSAANIKAIQESAKVSAVDQYSPYGSTTYQRNAQGVPISQTINLSPAEQQNYNLTSSLRNALAGRAGTLAGQLPTSAYQGPDSGSADAVAKALYDRKLALMQPDLDRANTESIVTLGERGIPIGSEIWNSERGRLDAARSNALTGAAQDAVLAAGQEQSRMQSDQLAARGTNYNEIAALLSGASGGQTPQFQATPAYQVQAPDISGLVTNAYNQQMQNYNSQRGSMMNGLFGLGAAGIGLLSDARAKEDIRRVGQLDSGLNVYAYKYKGSDGPTHIGLMAQEVEQVKPDAVGHLPGGLMTVNYDRAVA